MKAHIHIAFYGDRNDFLDKILQIFPKAFNALKLIFPDQLFDLFRKIGSIQPGRDIFAGSILSTSSL